MAPGALVFKGLNGKPVRIRRWPATVTGDESRWGLGLKSWSLARALKGLGPEGSRVGLSEPFSGRRQATGWAADPRSAGRLGRRGE